jgi:uncharacterized protein (TIGR00255 family)
MIRSMTGFGRARVAGEKLVVAVEARSINHRYLDVALKLPRGLAALEGEARRLIQRTLERGRVEVTINVAPTGDETGQQVTLDIPLARAYRELGRRLAAELAMDESPSLPWLLDRPGVIRIDEATPSEEETTWVLVERALTDALAELRERRESEGEALAGALRDLHAALTLELERMTARAPAATANDEARFRQRLQAMLGTHPVDEARVLTEVAIWAEKADVSEELTRMRAHLEQLELALKTGGAVGRPLDFLIQELNREVNTVASKADDLELAQAAIAAKGLLEKVREQVQNLE